MVPVILIQFYRVKVSLKTLINNLDRGFQGSRAEKSGPYSENAFIRIELWKKQAGSVPKKRSFVSSLAAKKLPVLPEF